MKPFLLLTYQSQYLKHTEKFLKNYAKKYNLDYQVLSETKEFNKGVYQYELYNLFNSYKRILFVSPKVIIRDDAPNLFEKIPVTHMGLLNEAQWIPRTGDMLRYFDYTKKPIKDWKGLYYNFDVIVASNIHKQVFKNPQNLELDKEKIEFHTYLNYKIQTSETKVKELNHRQNRIPEGDKKLGMTRLDSFLINYTSAPDDQLLPVLLKDIDELKTMSPEYKFKRNVVVSVQAGMGDQLCAEPAIRYLIENKLLGDANYNVVSHHPRLFQHLDGVARNVDKDIRFGNYHHNDYPGHPMDSTLLHSCPGQEDSFHVFTHTNFYPVDFATMSMYRRTIPPEDKTIKLELNVQDANEILDIVGTDVEMKDLVLVHAGKWWPSKTFPKVWWQEVVNKLAEKYTVGLIGKTIDDKQGYVDITCPDNAFDFRDITSLGGLIMLLSQAGIVLTNDSSPIHLAGAFDNWIVTIPTAKRPDHILPFRHGNQQYKNCSITNGRILYDELKTNHLADEFNNIDDIPEGCKIEDYMPEVDVVIGKIDLIKEKISKNENYL